MRSYRCRIGEEVHSLCVGRYLNFIKVLGLLLVGVSVLVVRAATLGTRSFILIGLRVS